MGKEEIPHLTVKDLSELFEVDRATIWKWRKEGLPYYQIGGNVRFKRDEVIKWIETKRITKKD